MSDKELTFEEMIQIGVRRCLTEADASEEDIEYTIDVLKELIPDRLSPLQASAVAVTMHAMLCLSLVDPEVEEGIKEETEVNEDKYIDLIDDDRREMAVMGLMLIINRALKSVGAGYKVDKLSLKKSDDDIDDALQKWVEGG